MAGLILFLVSNAAYSRNPSLPYLISSSMLFLDYLFKKENFVRLFLFLIGAILSLILLDIRRAHGSFQFAEVLFSLIKNPSSLLQYFYHNEFSTPLKVHNAYIYQNLQIYPVNFLFDYLIINPLRNLMGTLDTQILLSVKLSLVGIGSTAGGFPGSTILSTINPFFCFVTPLCSIIPLYLSLLFKKLDIKFINRVFEIYNPIIYPYYIIQLFRIEFAVALKMYLTYIFVGFLLFALFDIFNLKFYKSRIYK